LGLTTAPGTRAQGFYEVAGWSRARFEGDHLRFELRNPRVLGALRDQRVVLERPIVAKDIGYGVVPQRLGVLRAEDRVTARRLVSKRMV
jgi:hypothetical protein